VSAAATAGAFLAGLTFTTTVIAAIWAAGGVVSATVALPLAGGRRIPHGIASPEAGMEADTHRELAHSQSLLTASFNLIPVALALIVSAEMAGLAKAVVLPFGPWLAMVGGLRMVTLSAVTAWRLDAGPDRGRSPALRHTSLLLPVTIAAAMLSAGATRLVAERMEPLRDASPYLAFGIVFCVLFVAGQVLSDGLALGPTRHRALQLRVTTLSIEWVGLFTGALFGGPAAMLAGWLTGMAIGLVVWWVAVLRSGGPEVQRSRLDSCSPVRQPAPFPTPPVPTSSRTPMVG
jgi:hypothetical protein